MIEPPLPPGYEPDPEPVALPPLSDFVAELTPREAQTPLDAETDAIMQRRSRVARLRALRKSIKEIAEEVKCSVGTVHADIVALRDGWLRLSARSLRDHVAKALEDLNYRWCEAVAAWERSKCEVKEESDFSAKRGDSFHVSHSKKKKQSNGDPRYMEQIRRCWTDYCLLTGAIRREDAELADMADEIGRLRTLLRDHAKPTAATGEERAGGPRAGSGTGAGTG